MKIKILEKSKGCMPEIIKVGDWIDLCTAEDITLRVPHAKMLHKKKNTEENNTERFRDVVFTYTLIDLGVAMQLPEGFEAILAPRSSTFKKYGILQTNCIGIIDESYCGDEDIWKMPVLATRNITIPKGTRIAQFRIQLSQKATIKQKLKWLLSKGIKLKPVTSLSNKVRGGFGSTGDK